MFAIRGVAISFSVFALIYCAVSLAVICTWQRLHRRVQDMSVQRLANLLFTARMFPILVAALITAAFTIPSFLLLEPRAINEPLGDVPLVLAICGSALGLFGFVSAYRATVQASRKVSNWTTAAQPVSATAPFPVLRIQRGLPAMTATGILRPRILISGSAEFVLNGNELRTALNHEIAHIRRRDNFKKLLLRFVGFPGMQGLEAAWLQASEMAADDAAVSSTADALDLAAALIKISKLKSVERSPDLSAALVHGHAAAINVRVERLISWSAAPTLSGYSSFRRLLGVAVPILAVFAITYGSLLVDVHKATEWLVR